MNKVLFFTLFAATVFFSPACTKTNNVVTTIHDSTTVIVRDTVVVTTPKNPIVGEWVGTFHVDHTPAVDSFYYRLDISSDSIVYTTGEGDLYNGVTTYSAGPWKLQGTAFSATVTAIDGTNSNVQTLTAVYNSTAGTLSNGVYIDITGISQTGTFTLNRVP